MPSVDMRSAFFFAKGIGIKARTLRTMRRFAAFPRTIFDLQFEVFRRYRASVP